ncbi:MAG: Ppx/GppA phosphatase family protein [Thermoguttaceae bacterium]|nr:Ppx/GppA phosphatase family protein [Thermoguttaceae bacterium]
MDNEQTFTGTNPKPASRTFAAIDIGSNSVRMALAQVLPNGQIEVFERLQRALHLGQDVFLRGRIGARCMRGAVEILTDYKYLIDQYGATSVRVVATSALREASNADNFLDRVFLATGLDVEVIDVAEECRLTLSAVRGTMPDSLRLNRDHSLIVEAGGGNTILVFLENGEINNILGPRVGSIRMCENLVTGDESPERRIEVLSDHIRSSIGIGHLPMKLQTCETFVAVGGDARFAACEVGTPAHLIPKNLAKDDNPKTMLASDNPTIFAERVTDVKCVSLKHLNQLINVCAKLMPEQLARRYHLEFSEAETIFPALLVYRELLLKTRCHQMIVSSASMRDGVLADMALNASGGDDSAVMEGARQSARALAERYRVDLEHATQVAMVALRIFDAMQADHGLGARPRLLLELAAILHEVGTIVAGTAWHKHSYYLIAHSDIFGMTRDETKAIAHIARYHRRSPPKPNHIEYQMLPRKTRVLIYKLAAILRVADLLTPERSVSPDRFQFEHDDDEFIIVDAETTNPSSEERVLATRSEMFEDIFGLRIRIEKR